MYIEEIVLEGFKSYATRTHIRNLDPEFTAITGLNGSGKSNILDALIFVLGLSNLAQVRASNIQDLIYKQGQAGITKATVTLIFNNSDTDRSPAGYEHFKTITVSRVIRSQTGVAGGLGSQSAASAMNAAGSFLINGRNADKKHLVSMFQSVQLNIANPHFLIMQGQVTKVLNMKPREILGMIEEAAGTSLFESNKNIALKTIEKKDSKLNEIEQTIIEEIQPSMDKLKRERDSYRKYKEIATDCAQREKYLVALDYYILSRGINEQALQNAQEESDLLSATRSKTQSDLQHRISDLRALQAECDSLSGAATLNLEQSLREHTVELSKQKTTLRHIEDDLGQTNQSISGFKQSQADNDIQRARKIVQLSTTKTSLARLSAEVEAAQQTLTHKKGRLDNFKSGAVSTQNQDSLRDEHAELTRRKLAVTKELETLRFNQRNLEQKLSFERTRSGDHEQQILAKQQAVSSCKLEILNIENQLNPLKRQLIQLNQISKSKADTEAAYAQTQAQIDRHLPLIHDFDIHSSLASKSFFASISSKIHGTVINLFTVKDPKYMTAIETLLGDRLRHVVVSSQETASFLLKNANFKRKTFFLPLDKIVPQMISESTVMEAKKIVGAHQVSLALDLISYEDPCLRPAMRFLFGGTFVCANPNAAKSVTFNPTIRRRAVTLDGDIYEPSGTLSGGSRLSNASMLQSVFEAKQLFTKRDHLQQQLVILNDQYNQFAEMQQQQVKPLERQHQLLLHQLGLYETQLNEVLNVTNASSHIQEYEAKLEDLKLHIHQSELQVNELTVQIARSFEEMHRDKGSREEELLLLQPQYEKAKQKFDALKLNYKTVQESITQLESELEFAGKEAESAMTEMRNLEQQSLMYKDKHGKIQDAIHACEAAMGDLTSKLNGLRADLQAKQEVMKELTIKIAEKHDTISEHDREIKRLSLLILQLKREKEDNLGVIDSLKRKHAWISDQEQHFNVPRSAFDFTSLFDAQGQPYVGLIKEQKDQLAQMRDQEEKLKNTINVKAMHLFDRLETEHADLLEKKQIIFADKKKIQDSIREINEKKDATLQRVIKQVSHDFGLIYSTLLPGASARLVAQEGKSELDGLLVQISFGDTVKENLTELSGGQRSLMALSLLLSLSKTKPAPMYILDEVDAALDLSHTQNIGRLIKDHFKTSQFLVVSLKEGLFNHAKALYRTQFINGTSVVEQVVRRSNSKQ